jgi:DNA primase
MTAMPGRYFDYYSQVANRLLPYLEGRLVAIEQQFPDTPQIVYRRHGGGRGQDSWIRIDDRQALVDWARQYAEAFHANIRSEDDRAWFVIDIDSRQLPLEMGRLAATHAVDVLTKQGLAPLVKFSGSDGFHLMWEVPDVSSISDAELWETEREVVRAVACEVERRLETDPTADPIRRKIGAGHPTIITSSADRDNANALLFDEYILKENANFRVPFSIQPRTGLVAVPLTPKQLASFAPEQASPAAVAAKWPTSRLPRYRLEDIKKALDAWHADGC